MILVKYGAGCPQNPEDCIVVDFTRYDDAVDCVKLRSDLCNNVTKSFVKHHTNIANFEHVKTKRLKKHKIRKKNRFVTVN